MVGFFLAATLVQYVTDYDANTKHFHWETQGQTRNSSVKIQLLFSPRKKLLFINFLSLIQKEPDGCDIWVRGFSPCSRDVAVVTVSGTPSTL